MVADSALDREANLEQLAHPAITWITRVPATVSDAHVALAPATPPVMAPLQEGSRAHELTSSAGGVTHRWVLLDSAARPPQAQRPADTPLRQQTDQEVKAFTTLCHTTGACEAEARQALSALAQDVPVTCLATSPVRATPRDDTRGRPGTGVQPDQVVDPIDGALASSLTPRQALMDQHGCVLLATHERDETHLTPQERLEGSKGQGHAEGGLRLMQDPSVLASSRYLEKPERLMALFMGMTVCWLVYAAVEYRIRQALNDHEATFPDQQGHRIRNPTARWVWPYLVGLHVRCQPGQWPMVRNLTDAHRHWLRLLGQPSMRVSDVGYS